MNKFTKAIAAIMLMTVFATSCTKTDYPNNGSNNGSGGGNGNSGNDSHEYVDLGLPSETLWATCNVGAGSSEAHGYYFAWGETSSKLTYSWGNYKYCNGGDGRQLTKYCNNPDYGYNGFTDNLVVLQSSDDAATASWGGAWRTPSYEDWNELISYCTYVLCTTPNGVNGCLFTAPNGKTLFLPASGGSGADGIEEVGIGGVYKSNTLCYDNPTETMSFAFIPNYNIFGMKQSDREYGNSVRPVRSR